MSIAKDGFNKIMSKNGTAISLFTCDEHLSGVEAFQGTELCTVAESMFSAEKTMKQLAIDFGQIFLKNGHTMPFLPHLHLTCALINMSNKQIKFLQLPPKGHGMMHTTKQISMA